MVREARYPPFAQCDPDWHRSGRAIVDGFLNVDKSVGMTSFRVVSLVRQLSSERRVGHGGTLDPAASGVLPICLGRATRLSSFLSEATKTYRAEIVLGVSTDTYDADGRVVETRDIGDVDRDRLELALSGFRGLVQQVPPMFSAIKHKGQPLYRLARAGITIERKARPVNITSLVLAGWQSPVATVEVVCSKGTYIRSLAHDLGQALGCGAHLRSLVRLRCGIFDLKDALPLSQLQDAFRQGDFERFLYPLDSVLAHLPGLVLSDEAIQYLRNGRAIGAEDSTAVVKRLPPATPSQEECSLESPHRAYTLDGRFAGVLRFNLVTKEWQPEKVLL